MESKIGWVDLSPLQRDRVKKFMDLMGMGGVQDELGVGIIRDAMSNRIFPGFSTLYTRAKYFFITPYLLLDRDSNKQDKKQSGIDYFKKAEIGANKIIIDFYESHPDRMDESYFGKENKNGVLKRQPSEIYWNGILTLHLIESITSLDQLLLDKHSTMEELLATNRGDDTAKEQGENKGYCPTTVSYSKDWKEEIKAQGLTLSLTEAETLRDRLRGYTKDSLPAELVTNTNIWEIYKAAEVEYKKSEMIDNPFVWFAKHAYQLVSSDDLRKNLIAAHNLSLFLYGPHIAYNIRLWENAKASDSFILGKRSEGISWLQNLKGRMIDYDGFNINDCMTNANIKEPTRRFLNNVQTLISKSDNWMDVENALCDLAEQQERWNKKAKSRFIKLENERVIDEMKKKQWLGLGLINYRYTATLSVMKDIYEGLDNTVG